MKLTALLTTLCLGCAATATAQEVNIRSMDEACRTDPAYVDRCFILPESYASSITLWELALAFAEPHNNDPERVIAHAERLMGFIIYYNGWHGATKDLVIPAGVAFRTS